MLANCSLSQSVSNTVSERLCRRGFSAISTNCMDGAGSLVRLTYPATGPPALALLTVSSQFAHITLTVI